MQNTANQAKPGWQDASPRGGNYDWINDETLYRTLARHDVLWKRILYRCPNPEKANIVVLGYGSLPMAIELSQRGYSVTYVAQSEPEKERVERDCEVQAGLLVSTLVADWRTDIPKGTVCLFTGLLGQVKENLSRKWIELLLRRVDFIVCAEKTSRRDWKKSLDTSFNVHGLEYNKNEYTFLEIERW